jgi:hypothetical protein
MRRRPAREINIFNLSMLDVIASALGCFLILFIIAMQQQANAERRASEAAKELEQLKEDVREARKQPGATPKSLARAMCNAGADSVVVEISDWSAEDGDEVSVSFNDKVIVPSLALVATPGSQEPADKDAFSVTLELAPGVNDLVIEALSNGSLGHNSARVFVKPCRGAKSEEFKVDIDTTAERYPKTKAITIARE